MPMSACLIMTIIESYTTCMYVCGVVCAAFFRVTAAMPSQRSHE